MSATRTVLVIDDEPSNLAMMSTLLEGQGYAVLLADDGEKGFATAVEAAPDVILLDIFMPGEDGISICRRFRAAARTHLIPVIAVTGQGNREVKLAILEAGANDFLEKPVEPAELFLRLRNILEYARVDELRRSREDLARTLELNQALLDSFPFAAVMVDRMTQIVLLGNRLAREHGARAGELCRAGFGRIIGGAAADPICAACRADEAFATGREIRTIDHFHGGRWWDIFWIPISDQRYLHYLVDVTERKHTEKERGLLNEQLERERQLALVGRLAAGVAHEVRNPIHAILSLSDALESELGTEGGHGEFLRHMRIQVERLANFMRELLDLGKPVDRDSFSAMTLGALCAEALEFWRQGSPSTGGAAVVFGDLAGAQSTVRGETRRLQQALLNLIENAAQLRTEGPVRIDLPASAGNQVRILVVDQGPGLPPGRETAVFEPFVTTRRDGTGLGLSIVRHIVEEHGGRVTLRANVPPPGCTAEILLPRQPESVS